MFWKHELLENPPTDSAKFTPRSPSNRRPAIPVREARTDGRSWAVRRSKQLMAEYVAALGGDHAIDPVMLAKVRRVAELVTIAEKARAEMMSGSGRVNLDDLVRVEHTSDLALKRLNLDRRREPAAEQTLQEYAASVAAKASEGDPP
jgi:hypothetical protein